MLRSTKRRAARCILGVFLAGGVVGAVYGVTLADLPGRSWLAAFGIACAQIGSMALFIGGLALAVVWIDA